MTKTRIIEIPKDHYLLAIYGSNIGSGFLLKWSENAVYTIGRNETQSKNHIIVNKTADGQTDYSISRIHAQIIVKNGLLYIVNKSKSGVFVNNKLIRSETENGLKIGDEIEIVSAKKSTIFRLVEQGNWDFSWPKKAGDLFVTNLPKKVYIIGLLFLFLMIPLLITIYPFGKFYKENRKGEKITYKAKLWIPKAMIEDKDISYQSKMDDVNISKFAIGDVDGNGSNDIIAVNKKGNLIGLECTSLKYLWPRRLDISMGSGAGIALDDFDSDGSPDIFVPCKESRLAIIDGSTGLTFAKSNDEFLGGKIVGKPVTCDFDSNGYTDAAVISKEGAIYTGWQNSDGFVWKKLATEFYGCSQLSICNYNQMPIVIFGTDSGQIIGFNPLKSELSILIDVTKVMSDGIIYQIDPKGIANYCVDSLNVLCAFMTRQNVAFLGNLYNGKIIISVAPPDGIDTSYNYSGTVLNDVNKDGFPDMIINEKGRKIKAYNGKNENPLQKNILWTYELTEDNAFTTDIAVADLNSDHTGDIIIGDIFGRIYIIDGKNGKLLLRSEAFNASIASVPIVADVNKDGLIDIVIHTSDDNYYIISTNVSIAENAVLWGQQGHDPKNSNVFIFKRNGSNLVKTVLFFFCIMLIIFDLVCLFYMKETMKRRNQTLKATENESANIFD